MTINRAHHHVDFICVLFLVLLSLLCTSFVSLGDLQPPSSPDPTRARSLMVICRQLESETCTLGWILQLVDDAYLRADSSRIRPEEWPHENDRMTISGRILSYVEETKSWTSVDAIFLGCQKPTVDASLSALQNTIRLSCGDATYAFRRIDSENPYTCVRFSFAGTPKELYWGCFVEGLLSHGMMDLSITGSADRDVVSSQELWTWVLSVHNEAVFRVSASHVVVTSSLPLGATLEKITPSQGSCQSTNEDLLKIICSLGEIPSNGTATIEIAAVVGRDFGAPQLTATAAAVDQSESFDPLPSNDAVTKTVAVESSALVISPLCAATGESITISGLKLDVTTLGPDDVQVGGKPAKILAASTTGLVIEVPDLSQGVASIVIRGVYESANATVDPSCRTRTPSTEDAQSGFVAGEVLIFLQPGLSAPEVEQFKKDYGFKSFVEYPVLGFYRAALGDQPLKGFPFEGQPPVACRDNKRGTAPPVDLLLLIDRSGTMDESRLKPLLTELSSQMYCLLSRKSRVALMAYNNEVKLELPFALWSKEQYQALAKWIKQPLHARNTSHLEEALTTALDAFAEDVGPEVSKHIVVITRGPALPLVQNVQALVDRAERENVTIQGIGLVSSFFPSRTYKSLHDLAQATSRDVVFWQEQLSWTLPQAAMRTVVQGVYGMADCQEEDCLARIPVVPTDLPERTEGIIALLNQDPRVDEAFFNDLVDRSQSDPRLSEQKWLEALGLPQGWDDFFPHQGAGVSIAVIDTGVDLSLAQSKSPELLLSPLAPGGLSFAPGPVNLEHPPGQDEMGHGTAVSTIALASTGNEVNGAGVAPQATLIPMRVFARVGGEIKASNEAVAEALMSAFSLGVDVINMSLGCYGCNEKTESALRKYYEKLINNLVQKSRQSKRKVPVIVAASGNDGEPLIDSPAANPFVIAVGSIRPDFSGRSSFSNYGPELDFVTVGENDLTTVAGGGFNDPGSGTSFASPQVAGLAALVLGEEPGLSPSAVQEKIKQCFTVDVGEPGFDPETGWGRIWIPPLSQAKPGCTPKT